MAGQADYRSRARPCLRGRCRCHSWLHDTALATAIFLPAERCAVALWLQHVVQVPSMTVTDNLGVLPANANVTHAGTLRWRRYARRSERWYLRSPRLLT